MKLGLFYVALGKYRMFWDRFYQTAEQFLLPGVEKHYFVINDWMADTPQRVHPVHKDKPAWPYPTLMRYHYADSMRQLFVDEGVDYIFFYNANSYFLNTVQAEEICPQKGLTAMLHAISPQEYERNARSKSYIAEQRCGTYYQACLTGGSATEYLDTCRLLRTWVDEDLANNVIPAWWDEAYWNKYLFHNPPAIALPCSYLYSQPDHPHGLQVKAVQIDKSTIPGGHEALRA